MRIGVGPYRVERLLGRGATGEVYAATDPRTGSRAAVKVLAASPGDLETRARFEREAAAALAVVHPNVVRALEAGFDGTTPWVAYELVGGGSLRDTVRREGRLPWRSAVGLATGVARGLEAIHARGLVHRDLKPENLLLDADRSLDESRRVRIADLGLARPLDGSSLTRTGAVLGTLEYLSPEQANGGKALDARSDLYSLGVLLHELISGDVPFRGEPLALVKKHLTEAPPSLASRAPDVPRALDALVRELLAKTPDARPATASAVAARLAKIEGLPDATRSRAFPAAALTIGGVLVLAGGALVALPRAPRPAASPPPPTRSSPVPAPVSPATVSPRPSSASSPVAPAPSPSTPGPPREIPDAIWSHTLERQRADLARFLGDDTRPAFALADRYVRAHEAQSLSVENETLLSARALLALRVVVDRGVEVHARAALLEGFEAARRAIAIRADGQLYAQLAAIELWLDDPRSARGHATRAIEQLDPRDATFILEAWKRLGLASARILEWNDASTAFERAADREPTDLMARTHRSVLRGAFGDRAGADSDAVYADAHRADWGPAADMVLSYARAELLAGRFAKARLAASEAILRRPSAGAYELRAAAAEALGDAGAAAADRARAEQLRGAR